MGCRQPTIAWDRIVEITEPQQRTRAGSNADAVNSYEISQRIHNDIELQTSGGRGDWLKGVSECAGDATGEDRCKSRHLRPTSTN